MEKLSAGKFLVENGEWRENNGKNIRTKNGKRE
jgi:hypothetical protein